MHASRSNGRSPKGGGGFFGARHVAHAQSASSSAIDRDVLSSTRGALGRAGSAATAVFGAFAFAGAAVLPLASR